MSGNWVAEVVVGLLCGVGIGALIERALPADRPVIRFAVALAAAAAVAEWWPYGCS